MAYYALIKLLKANLQDRFEHIGDWLHTFNVSNWREIRDREEKERLVAELLNKY